MKAAQIRLCDAIVANLRASICDPAVMTRKAIEYRANAARDLSIAAEIKCRETASGFLRSAANQIANAVATETAIAIFTAQAEEAAAEAALDAAIARGEV